MAKKVGTILRNLIVGCFFVGGSMAGAAMADDWQRDAEWDLCKQAGLTFRELNIPDTEEEARVNRELELSQEYYWPADIAKHCQEVQVRKQRDLRERK